MLRSATNSRQFLFQDQAAVVAATRNWVNAKAGFVDCLNVQLAIAHGKHLLATFDKEAPGLGGTARI
jgi:predicted nucleic-acid-binding protein